MCLGRGSLDSAPLCALSEEVFAALPWPCAVWQRDSGRVVMVNGAFLSEFGISRGRAGPAWIDRHLEPDGDAGEVVFRDRHAPARRFRMTRQAIDAASGPFEAVFLMPLPDDETGKDGATVTSHATSLRPGVGLTRRESQVLDGIMQGKLNKVIAGELDISPKTVELHRANLMAKLRVHNVVELARAVLDGTVSPYLDEPAIAMPVAVD
ncbi:MAG TPA: LuxR C-terminal-related transcriptional regulator [Luteibacter sp.]|uniref:LuxR C-terminal-related transcriptional regulator n=1 Tax=Luteibacter sp. TaxID=1886636 RepID=UPI002C73E750|nr:LuxR C-terminal-related transcriptional regulator [Luteibacter sp.]HVI56602.1 LuxR C-terminal-related transcriptional regulator [Luteibacter sp.]